MNIGKMTLIGLVCAFLVACGGGDPDSNVDYVDNPLEPAPTEFVGPPAPQA
jgi:hypothetical protein